jgi:uroporphyrinogen decarboxylase
MFSDHTISGDLSNRRSFLINVNGGVVVIRELASRGLVKGTLEFDRPARIPRQLWYLPWAQIYHPQELGRIRRDFPDDIVSAPLASPQISEDLIHAYSEEGVVYQTGTFTDEWGATFTSVQSGVIGEIKEPLIKAWSDLDRVRLPREYMRIDKEAVRDFCRGSDKFILQGGTPGSLPRPFERLQFLRGTVNTLIDLMDRPKEMFMLLERMHEFYKELVEIWAQTDVDAIWFMDDWGSQKTLLISPAVWREIFKPLYKDYIDIAHRYGKYTFMHSDGYIKDILPDLIELGLDAVNSQIFCMDLETLEQFAGKITFWGEIDRQQLLSFGTPQDIFDAVRQVRQHLCRDGGVIAQCEFGAGAKPENVYAVYDAWNGTEN